MILDTLANISKYTINTKVTLVELQKYILSQKDNLFQKGRFEIKADEFFGIGLKYETQDEANCLWEAHRKYFDVHYILEGEEIINISNIGVMSQTMEYDSDNDYQLFEGEKQHSIKLKKGYVLILFPNECHQTAVEIKETATVKKIVFKLT